MICKEKQQQKKTKHEVWQGWNDPNYSNCLLGCIVLMVRRPRLFWKSWRLQRRFLDSSLSQLSTAFSQSVWVCGRNSQMFALFLWPRPAGPDSSVLEIIARLPPLYQVVTRISINAQPPLQHSLTIRRAAAIWPKFGMFKLFHALFHMRQACT